MESVCLTTVGKVFHTVGLKKKERLSNVIVRCLRIHRIPLSEEERRLLLAV